MDHMMYTYLGYLLPVIPGIICMYPRARLYIYLGAYKMTAIPEDAVIQTARALQTKERLGLGPPRVLACLFAQLLSLAPDDCFMCAVGISPSLLRLVFD